MNKKNETVHKIIPLRFRSGLASWLGRGVFQGLVVALVAAGALYAYAAVTNWPPEPAAPTGLEAVFVGLSTTKYDAALGGYKEANDKCDILLGSTITGSHICTADEIIHSYNLGLATTTGTAWINNGPPGYDATLVNDCKGWTSVDSSVYGSVWNFGAGKNYSSIMYCSSATSAATRLPFACCK